MTSLSSSSSSSPQSSPSTNKSTNTRRTSMTSTTPPSIRLFRTALVLVALSHQQEHGSANANPQGVSFRGSRPKEVFSFKAELKCFETTKELRAAVIRYKGYNHFDEELASTYGWPIGNWCVSSIQDFSALFRHRHDFNEPLDGWDMSSAVSTRGMFQDNVAFNQDLSMWKLAKCKNTSQMFMAATAFNSDITSWNVSQCEDMEHMFHHALTFNQNLASWDVSRVTNMKNMFFDARSFHYEADIVHEWNFHEHVNTTNMLSPTTH